MPAFEQRVARLEEDMKDVKSSLRAIEAKLGSIDVGVAEMRGRLAQSPTWVQLLGAILATWAAGAAIAYALVRAVQP